MRRAAPFCVVVFRDEQLSAKSRRERVLLHCCHTSSPPILTTNVARPLLWQAFRDVQREPPFELTAIVLLTDHRYAIWELPPGDSNDSTCWRRIKRLFTSAWLAAGGESIGVIESRARRLERGVWQRQSFEHTCRDSTDLKCWLD